MRLPETLVAVLVLLALVSNCQSALATEYDLYLLLGQSNMEGYGRAANVPDSITDGVSDVMIFHGNAAADGIEADGRGTWARLRPGHGVGFSSDGTDNHYSRTFGIELSFAARLTELRPERRIAIFKYARGGTSLDASAIRQKGTWAPAGNFRHRRNGVNQYGHALQALEYATDQTDVDGDGECDNLVPAAVIWLQGERDARARRHITVRYPRNLQTIVYAFRQHLHDRDLPFVIAAIADSGRDDSGYVLPHGKIVQAAQAAYAASDNASAFVQLHRYGFIDRHHFDSDTLLALGVALAESAAGFLSSS